MNRKKYIAAVLAAASAAAFTAFAEGEISVLLNGEKLSFDTEPRVEEGRTLVPMRKIFESLGADVQWDGGTRTITASRDDTSVIMRVGDREMSVNGAAVTLDAEPRIENDRTLVPLRAVAESFGADVQWDGDTKTVTITEGSQSSPVPENTPAPENTAECPIDVSEVKSDSVNNFTIKEWSQNESGDYEITAEFFTFREGRGDVSADFACLDDKGREIGSFGGMYKTTDYTWSIQSETVTVPAETVKITLKE